ncbi:DNA polymerase beta domain-containing protein region [Candidatus Magnetomorum sp. HK-1]|nr:DNA polymerase beta domain-containing protein region [Candidatus Magnetomorum sp. HK-1]
MKFGLSEKTIYLISNFFSNYPEVEKVKIYGSRAMGNYERGSDIDLAIWTNTKKDLTGHFLTELEELSTPYFFDATDYNQIVNEDLKAHIDRVGKLIYRKI